MLEIALGLAQHLDEFVRSLRGTAGRRVEAFPFPNLTRTADGPWQGICRAMVSATTLHFTVKGMTKENLRAWMARGGHLTELRFGQSGWTNRELYEVLTNPILMKKTTFYEDAGDIDAWLVSS